MQKRSRGSPQKNWTYLIQFLSAIIFLLLGLTISYTKKNIWFSFLFISEGIGQFFLAKENQNSLINGDTFVSYFKKNRLGFLAALSFSFTMMCRYYLAASYGHSFNRTLVEIGSLSTLIYLLIYYFVPLKTETLSGLSALLIIFSSTSLGLFSLINAKNGFDSQLAINQLTYTSLLLLGILFVKPWVAEVLNIILWGALFILIIIY